MHVDTAFHKGKPHRLAFQSQSLHPAALLSLITVTASTHDRRGGREARRYPFAFSLANPLLAALQIPRDILGPS